MLSMLNFTLLVIITTIGAIYFTREDAKRFILQLPALSISLRCHGPVASTLRASTIDDPFYGYSAQQEKGDRNHPEAIDCNGGSSAL